MRCTALCGVTRLDAAMRHQQHCVTGPLPRAWLRRSARRGLAGGQTNEPWGHTSPVQGGRAEIGKVVGRPDWKTSLGVMAPPGDS